MYHRYHVGLNFFRSQPGLRPINLNPCLPLMLHVRCNETNIRCLSRPEQARTYRN